MSDQPHDDPAHTPQGDHTPRQEEQAARERQQQAQGQAQAAAPAVDPQAAAAAKEAQAASSIGAQIILDYNGEGSLGARGGMGATVEENTLARDAHLVAVGLDPVSPSGPPLGRPVEEPPPPATRHQELSGQATRMSSLAAGAITGDREAPTPPPPAREA